MPHPTRRAFASTLLASTALDAQSAPPIPAAPAPDEPHLGSLYPLTQSLADSAPMSLSFLRPQFRSLAKWQTRARALVFDRLLYSPAPFLSAADILRTTDHPAFTREDLLLHTAPGIRVPAYLLLPKNAKRPAPAVVALHDHGGFYLWGKEKLLAAPNEHPALTQFRDRAYAGRSIAADLARAGHAVLVIDMLYWGERRLSYAADPPALRDRSNDLTTAQVNAFNSRSSQNEQLFARSLFTAGVSWPGLVAWDDLRAVDYLARRPEVDPNRIACVGLSVGGYRSFLLAALEPRIKVAIDICWMTSYPRQLRRQVIHTVGFSFHIPGLLPALDLPDLSALIAPRALMVVNGSRDTLFHPDGIKVSHAKIQSCYRKAGASDRQLCRVYDAPHEFNAEMQSDAWDWLAHWL